MLVMLRESRCFSGAQGSRGISDEIGGCALVVSGDCRF